MKKFALFKTISIEAGDNEWKVNIIKQDGERRIKKDNAPNPMGFYHYPESIPDNVAFEELKNLMIKQHEERIARLTESLNKLKKVKI